MKYSVPRPTAVFDTECLPGYWSIGLKSLQSGIVRVIEMYEGRDLDKRKIAEVARKFRLVGFNSEGYDIPMLLYAMSGASTGELKRLNDEIIVQGTPHWMVMERLGLKRPDFLDHIDLRQVSPGAPQMPSLKLLGGRVHSRKMQEMPVDVDTLVTSEIRDVIRGYHANDLDTTEDVLNDLKAQIELRCLMSDEYRLDLRSKSDAQIAEAVIKSEMEKITGRRFYKVPIKNEVIKYQVPSFIKFKTAKLQEVLRVVRNAEFRVALSDGVVRAPQSIKDLLITIGNMGYEFGIGGLHSTESQVSHYSDERGVLLDRDVTSYYPKIILLCKLFPDQFGPKFLEVYERIFNRRVAAKKAGLKDVAETLKIVLNGSFGKYGSPYSVLYSPDLMLQVTLTGQLALLMQIERLEEAGISVVSANTDGVVSKVPHDLTTQYAAIYAEWERETGFQTEETKYRSLHSRDVNSYIAIKQTGDSLAELVAGFRPKVTAKLKGAYTDCGPGLPGAAGQKKNPDAQISTEAAVDFLKWGVPIEETIAWETDFRKFITVRRVTGGAEQEGQYVGKTIRWYYSTESKSGFVYKNSGKAVPSSMGAKPCMELPGVIPADVDYSWYIREAYAILEDVGASKGDPKLIGRKGEFFGRLPDQKTYHVVDARRGVAICGKSRDSVRETWVEIKERPEGRLMCSKCRKEEL